MPPKRSKEIAKSGSDEIENDVVAKPSGLVKRRLVIFADEVEVRKIGENSQLENTQKQPLRNDHFQDSYRPKSRDLRQYPRDQMSLQRGSSSSNREGNPIGDFATLQRQQHEQQQKNKALTLKFKEFTTSLTDVANKLYKTQRIYTSVEDELAKPEGNSLSIENLQEIRDKIQNFPKRLRELADIHQITGGDFSIFVKRKIQDIDNIYNKMINMHNINILPISRENREKIEKAIEWYNNFHERYLHRKSPVNNLITFEKSIEKLSNEIDNKIAEEKKQALALKFKEDTTSLQKVVERLYDTQRIYTSVEDELAKPEGNSLSTEKLQEMRDKIQNFPKGLRELADIHQITGGDFGIFVKEKIQNIDNIYDKVINMRGVNIPHISIEKTKKTIERYKNFEQYLHTKSPLNNLITFEKSIEKLSNEIDGKLLKDAIEDLLEEINKNR